MKKKYSAPVLEVFLYETDSDVMAAPPVEGSIVGFKFPGNPLLPYGNMDDVYGLGDEDDD